jgi:hypothetical protein
MLLTVSGPLNENLTIQQFATSHKGRIGKVLDGIPIDFIVKLKNNGNVHEQPVGEIVITDMFGKKVANLNVNSPPRNVLPRSTRKFQSPLDSTVIGNKKLFGRYHATLTVSYGTKQKVKSELTFWVIPWKLIVAVIAILIIGFFAIREGLRRYNRAIIRRSGGHRR